MDDEICKRCGQLASSKSLGETLHWDDRGQRVRVEIGCSHGIRRVWDKPGTAKKALEAAIRAIEKPRNKT